MDESGAVSPIPPRVDASSSPSVNPSNASMSSAPPPYSEAVSSEPYGIVTQIIVQNEVSQPETLTTLQEQTIPQVVEITQSQVEPVTQTAEISSMNPSQETGTPRN